jgi:peptide subunit release factor 1 (eRF1)
MGMAVTDRLSTELDRLASFEPGGSPVISLYLNLTANQHGRDQFEAFLRKELNERLRTYPAGGPELRSLEQDAEQIREYMTMLDPAANGLALFACSAAGLFEPFVLSVPIPEHRLYISDRPHLYPLARALDAAPRYAVVVANTHSARIFVVAANMLRVAEEVHGVKTRRHKMGGWAQARYQRHIDNYHEQHAKEVVAVLSRVVKDEQVEAVLIGGDEVIVPLLKDYLPKDLAARIVDVLKLDVRAPEREVLDTTLETMRGQDAETDRAKVDQVLSEYRANGLGIVGVKETALALERGQVDELLVTAAANAAPGGSADNGSGAQEVSEQTAEQLIVKARQTSATIRFIEDPSLLSEVGGVGALLRFKLESPAEGRGASRS